MLDSWLVFGVALPLAVSAVVLGVALAVGRVRGLGTRAADWGVALGVGAGAAVIHLGRDWRPGFPPLDVADRTPWLVPAALAVGLLGPMLERGGGAAWPRRVGLFLLATLVYVAILGPILPATAGTRAGLGWLAVTAVLVLAAWENVAWLTVRVEGGALLGSWLAVAAGTGVVLLVSGSLTLGQLGLALASALVAPLLLSWRWPLGPSVRSAAPIVLAVLTALLLNGHVYASLPTASALLVAAAPAGAWLARIGPARRRPWLATSLAVAGTLVPLGVAVGFALAAQPLGDS